MSADRTLTIAAGATESTGTVKITAVDNAVDGPDKEVTVTAAVTGPGGLTDPPAETLTITDRRRLGADRDAGAVPERISEDGGESRVTAQLSGATTGDVTVTVSASPVSPADADDFALSANRAADDCAGQDGERRDGGAGRRRRRR